jgi:hypothetical protein
VQKVLNRLYSSILVWLLLNQNLDDGAKVPIVEVLLHTQEETIIMQGWHSINLPKHNLLLI